MDTVGLHSPITKTFDLIKEKCDLMVYLCVKLCALMLPLFSVSGKKHV